MIVHAPCEAMRGYWCAQTVRTLLQVPNRLTASIDLEPSAIGALAALIVRAGAVSFRLLLPAIFATNFIANCSSR